MPRVPGTDNFSPVRTSGAPAVFQSSDRATLATFGGTSAAATVRAGQALQGTGDEFAKVALQEAEATNKRKAKELDTLFRQRVRGLTFGDDQQDGYYALTGAAAVDGRAPAEEEIEKAYNEILGQATNQQLTDLVKPSLDNFTSSTFDRMARHSQVQEDAARNTAHQSRLDAAVQDAANGYSDPTAVAEAKALGVAEINEFMSGASPEERADAVEAFMTTINAEVVNEYNFAGRFDDARAYLSRTQKQMDRNTFRVLNAETDRLEKKAKAENDAAEVATQNEFLVRMQAGDLTASDILGSNLEPFGEGSKDTFLRMLNKDANTIRTDPVLFQALFDRINRPDGDAAKITDENFLNQYVESGRLTFEDLNRLRGEIQGKKTSAGKMEADLRSTALQAAKVALTASNPLLGIRDPKGSERFLAFSAWFDAEYKAGRDDQKTPRQLLDPTSPDYIVGPGIEIFKRSQQQIIQDLIVDNPTFSELDDGDADTVQERMTASPIPPEAPERTVDATGESIFFVNDRWVFEDGRPYDPSAVTVTLPRAN